MLDWSNPGKKYAEMALDFTRLQGIKNGNIPVIKRDTHPQEWRDWYAYYGFRRLKASQELMRTKLEKTVPTFSPFDFDAEFNLRYPAPEVPREGDGGRRAPLTDEQRERHMRMFPQLFPNLEIEKEEEPESNPDDLIEQEDAA